MLISCKPWATWLSRMYIIFLPGNSDRTVTVTRAEWVSRCLWDHSIVTDHHPNYKRARCESCLPSHKWIYACFPSVFYTLLPALSAPPSPLTLTARDPPSNGQLNVLILAKTVRRRITSERRPGYLSVNGGSLAFAGIWGPPITE